MPDALIPSDVLNQYGLAPDSATSLPEFSTIQPYRLSCQQGEFLLYRRNRRETAGRVTADHALIAYLVKQNFPTHAPIQTLTGETWFEYDGYLYELYPSLHSLPFEIGNRDQIASVGRLLGQYHALAGDYRPAQPKPNLDHTPSLPGYLGLKARVAPIAQTLVDGHHAKPEIKKTVRKIADSIEKQIDHYRDEKTLTWCMVHGDVQPEHVIFDEAGGVRLINWSGSHAFSRVLDVASALLKFTGRRADADLPGQVGPLLTWPRVEAFASAYREFIRLTPAEGGLLQWLMLAMRLNDALWYETGIRLKYGREIGLTRELAEWLDQNGAALGEMFSG
jgi:Ser/Thr protein kinase RdoA (MazF antagonist)